MNHREFAAGRRTDSRGRARVGAAIGIGVGGSLVLALAPPAEAADFTVTNKDPEGAGSLRQAILDSDAAWGADRILFQAGLSGTIDVKGDIPEYIFQPLQIIGPGAGQLTIDAGGASKILVISGAGDVTISGLIFTGGNGAWAGPGDAKGGAIYSDNANLHLENVVATANEAEQGGAVFAKGGGLTIVNSDFTGNEAIDEVVSGSTGGGAITGSGAGISITDSTFTGNEASGFGALGGAVKSANGGVGIARSTFSANAVSSFGSGGAVAGQASTISVQESTVSGNLVATGQGGGIAAIGGAGAAIRNSTISGNRANTVGGGPGYPGGGAVYAGMAALTIDSSTVADNSAESGAPGGGVMVFGADPTLTGTIVSGNTAAGGGPDLSSSNDPGDTFTATFSLIGSTAGADFANAGNNKIGVDPQLGPLADNGGLTKTRQLAATSPAVDAGGTDLTADQRGIARPQGTQDDIGAVELFAPPVQITSPPAARGADNTPTIAFSSASADLSGFQCSIDGAAFAACTSPLTTPALADGEHTFRVRAVSGAGAPGAPASAAFTIDTTGPATRIDEAPPAETSDRSSTILFSSAATDLAGFQCSIDGAAFSPCVSPLITPNLDDGPHTVAVRAADDLGNIGPQQLVAFTVDTDNDVLSPTVSLSKKSFFKGKEFKAKISAGAKEDVSSVATGAITVKGKKKKRPLALLSKTTKLKQASGSSKAGARAVLLLKFKGAKKKRQKLSRKLARSIRKASKVSVAVNVQLTDAGGNSVTQRRTAKIKSTD